MSSHVLIGNILITTFFSAWSWTGSVFTNNYSYIDRLWSILPPFYCLWVTQEYTNLLNLPDPLQMWIKYPKLGFMLLLPLLWGIRLTYNFARKGGYRLTGEDYRWEWLRTNTAFKNPVLFQLFNIFFISIYQTLILQLLTHPMYLVVHVLAIDQGNSIGQMSWLDWLLTIGFFALLAVEYFADEQQWAFYTIRNGLTTRTIPARLEHTYGGYTWSRHDFAKGFNDKYLFKFSRHPNFIAEFSMWFVYATYAGRYTCIPQVVNGITLYPTWNEIVQMFVNFDVMNGFYHFFTHPITVYLGATLLWLIFLGSTALTEHISGRKYPDYAIYQQTTPRLVPNPVHVVQGLGCLIKGCVLNLLDKEDDME